MNNAERMKAVIERASRDTSTGTWAQRLDNMQPSKSSQRTPTNQPKHETPKKR